MTALRIATASAALAAALGVGGGLARAQECPDPPPAGPLEGIPASGAPNVTLDAFVSVRYTPGYFALGGLGDDPARSLRLGSCPFGCGTLCSIDEATPIPGLIQVHGDHLVFVPDEPLAPETQHVALATGVDGGLEIEFCTGTRFDVRAPTLGAIGRDLPVRVGPQCGLPDGGYRVGVYFEPATDDGPGGSIEYLLYLTRGVGVDEPRLVARAPNYAATDQITMSLLLEPELGTTPVCVQLAAVDGVGNVTVNDEQHCFDPITRTWFYGGCSIGARSERAALSSPIALACVALFARALRRRKRTP